MHKHLPYKGKNDLPTRPEASVEMTVRSLPGSQTSHLVMLTLLRLAGFNTVVIRDGGISRVQIIVVEPALHAGTKTERTTVQISSKLVTIA